MAGPEDVDDELEGEITDEATKYGIVERVVIYQERQSEKPGDVIIKIFILFQSADRTTFYHSPTAHPPTAHPPQLMVVLC